MSQIASHRHTGFPPREPGLLRRAYLWFVRGLPGDVRSSVVASAVAGIWLSVASSCSAASEVEIASYLDKNGMSSPLPAIVRLMKADDQPTSVTFEPANLAGLRVCEFAHMRAASGRELLLSYIDRYSMCLDMSEGEESSFVIRPNRRSQQMTQDPQGNWLCKCSVQ